MSLQKTQSASDNLLKGVILFLIIAGGIALLYSFFIWDEDFMPIVPGIFSETIKVPVQFYNLGPDFIPLEVENFLLFQNFESLPPSRFPQLTLLYGGITWLLFNIGLALVSMLKKMYFIGATGILIVLLSLSGINGLNIVSIASNYALIVLLVGTLVPTILLSFFAERLSILIRFGIIFLISSSCLYLMTHLAENVEPWLWLSENFTFVAAIISALFLLHIGHAVISGSSYFLIELNKGSELKISYHITILFILYFLLVLFTLLGTMGEVNLPFPTVPPLILMVVAGTMGYFVLQLKVSQIEQPYEFESVGKLFYLLGFAFTTWTWARAGFVGNQPLSEFFNHIFLYGQIALSLMFFLYLMANFSELINTGKDIETILFKPEFFAYFHMRIGAVMALVILIIYADGIIATQLAATTTNLQADYYYQNDKKLEAAILYENSWLQYRRNRKAKNATVHLNYILGEPSQGLDHLMESFDYAPTVQNTLMLSSKLHTEEKIFESLFYLEKGLEIFPGNAYIKNNLALLYSKLNRPNEAMAQLLTIEGDLEEVKANKLGLSIKHQLGLNDIEPESTDKIYRINFLAYKNKKGDFAPFVMNTEDLQENYLVKTAILRNQYTNKVDSPYAKDIEYLDSMINQEQMSFEERNFRETRLLRTLQEDYINETLKYLNGTGQAYPNSAGYYHALAAKVLAGNLDFQKAAIDIMVAAERGFEAFQPYHLALLYYGGKPGDALGIHTRYGVNFPAWMNWNADGRMLENDYELFLGKLANLHTAVGPEVIATLENFDSPEIKADYANAILLYKLHWFDTSEYKKIKAAILAVENSIWSDQSLDTWYEFIHSDQKEAGELPKNWISLESDWTRNAYWAPLIYKSLAGMEDNMAKYEILQEAIQFNRDPKLWILFVKQSRKLGLDSYASNALQEMQGWLTTTQIEKLQMENL